MGYLDQIVSQYGQSREVDRATDDFLSMRANLAEEDRKRKQMEAEQRRMQEEMRRQQEESQRKSETAILKPGNQVDIFKQVAGQMKDQPGQPQSKGDPREFVDKNLGGNGILKFISDFADKYGGYSKEQQAKSVIDAQKGDWLKAIARPMQAPADILPTATRYVANAPGEAIAALPFVGEDMKKKLREPGENIQDLVRGVGSVGNQLPSTAVSIWGGLMDLANPEWAVGKDARRTAEKMSKDSLDVAKSYSDIQQEFEGTKTRDTIPFKLGSTAGQLAKTVAISALASPVTAGIVAGAEQYGNTGQESYQKTGKFNQGAAAADAVVSGILERLPLTDKLGSVALRGGGGGILGRAMGGFLSEGAEEGSQQFASNLIAQKTFDPERDLSKGVLESAIYGGLAGAGGGVALHPKMASRVEQEALAEGRTPEEAKKIVADLNLQIQTNPEVRQQMQPFLLEAPQQPAGLLEAPKGNQPIELPGAQPSDLVPMELPSARPVSPAPSDLVDVASQPIQTIPNPVTNAPQPASIQPVDMRIQPNGTIAFTTGDGGGTSINTDNLNIVTTENIEQLQQLATSTAPEATKARDFLINSGVDAITFGNEVVGINPQAISQKTGVQFEQPPLVKPLTQAEPVKRIKPLRKQEQVSIPRSKKGIVDALATEMGKYQKETGGVQTLRTESSYGNDNFRRESTNPEWYRDFYAKNKKAPTKADIREIAQEMLDNNNKLAREMLDDETVDRYSKLNRKKEKTYEQLEKETSDLVDSLVFAQFAPGTLDQETYESTKMKTDVKQISRYFRRTLGRNAPILVNQVDNYMKQEGAHGYWARGLINLANETAPRVVTHEQAHHIDMMFGTMDDHRKLNKLLGVENRDSRYQMEARADAIADHMETSGRSFKPTLKLQLKNILDSIVYRFKTFFGKSSPLNSHLDKMIKQAKKNKPNVAKKTWFRSSEEVAKRNEAIDKDKPSFYLRVPGKKTELMVTHNLSAKNLAKAKELGGLPQPSVGIVDPTKSAIDGFGEITLLGNTGLVDPAQKGTRTFGSDAYTPRQPQSVLKKGSDTRELLDNYFADSIKKYSNNEPLDLDAYDSVNEALEGHPAVMGKFLEENGIKPEIGESRIDRNTMNGQIYDAGLRLEYQMFLKDAIDNGDGDVQVEDLQSTFMKNHNIEPKPQLDYNDIKYNLRKQIRDNDLEDKFYEYTHDISRQHGATPKIFAGTTATGTQRWLDETMDNVLKTMRKNRTRAGEQGWGSTGSLASTKAKISKEYRSINDIIKDKDKLTSNEVMESTKLLMEQKMEKLHSKLEKYAVNLSSNQFTEYDLQMEAISDYVAGGREKQWFFQKFQNIPDSIVKELDAFRKELKDAPTEYFESVSDRAVGLNEFEKALVPKNIDQKTLAILKEEGIEPIFYEDGKRQEKLLEAMEADNKKDSDTPLFQKQDPLDDLLAEARKYKSVDDYLTAKLGGYNQIYDKNLGSRVITTTKGNIRYSIKESGDSIKLFKLLADKKGTGVGDDLVKSLKDYSDATGKPIIINTPNKFWDKYDWLKKMSNGRDLEYNPAYLNQPSFQKAATAEDIQNLAPTEKLEEVIKSGRDIKESKKEKAKKFFSQANEQLIDKYSPVRKLSKEYKKLTGKDLEFEKDPYSFMRLHSGIVGKINDRLESFTKILEGVKDKKVLEQAGVLRRILTDRSGIKNPLTQEEAQQAQDELRAKLGEEEWAKTEKAVDDVIAYHDDMLKMLQEEGVISQDSYDAIKAKNQNYFGKFEVIDYLLDNNKNMRAGKSFSVASQDVIKKQEGTEKSILSPIESTIKQTAKIIDLISRNKAAKALTELSSVEGMESTIMPLKSGETVPTGYEKVSAFRDGVKQDYAVLKDIGEAFKQMNKQQADIVTKVARRQASWLRSGATSLNLGFAAISNPIRDLNSLAVNSKNTNLLNMGLYWTKGLAQAIGRGKYYREFMRSGGGQSGYFSQEDVPTMARDIMESKAKKIGRTVTNPKQLFGLIPTVEAVGNKVELAPRLAEYIAGRKKGKSPEQAAFDARNVTVDFGKSGNIGQIMNQWVPFLNARAQGSVNTINAVRTQPLKAGLAIGATAILPAILTFMHNMKEYEEEWRKIPGYVKDNNFIIIYGKETDAEGNLTQVIKIPKGDAAKIATNPTERFMEFMYNGKPLDFAALSLEMLSNISPVDFVGEEGKFAPAKAVGGVMPPGIKALVEGLTNYSFYRDAPLVSQKLQNLPAREQVYDSTSEGAKLLGNLTGVSPIKIDNAIRDMSGGFFGQFSAKGLAQGTIGRLSGAPGNALENQFYSTYSPLQQDRNSVSNQINQALEVGDINKAKDLANSYNDKVYKTFADKDLDPSKLGEDIQKKAADLLIDMEDKNIRLRQGQIEKNTGQAPPGYEKSTRKKSSSTGKASKARIEKLNSGISSRTSSRSSSRRTSSRGGGGSVKRLAVSVPRVRKLTRQETSKGITRLKQISTKELFSLA